MKILRYSELPINANLLATDGLIMYNEQTGQWEAVAIGDLVALLNIEGAGFTTAGQVVAALEAVQTPADKLNVAAIDGAATTAEVAGKKALSDEDNELNFAATNAWNFEGKQSAIFLASLTADLVPVFSGMAKLKTAVGEVTVDAAFKITLNAEWRPLQLPDTVTWDDVNFELSFAAPAAGTVYNWFCFKVNGVWKLNIQQE